MENKNIRDNQQNNQTASWSGNFSFQDEVDTNIKPPKPQSETADKSTIILPEKANKKD